VSILTSDNMNTGRGNITNGRLTRVQTSISAVGFLDQEEGGGYVTFFSYLADASSRCGIGNGLNQNKCKCKIISCYIPPVPGDTRI
jgi:hypothetical protein